MDSDDLDADDDDDDDEEEEGVEGLGSSSQPGGLKGAEELDGLRRYMDEMDQELLGTNMGQSFTQKVRKRSPTSCLLSSSVCMQTWEEDYRMRKWILVEHI